MQYFNAKKVVIDSNFESNSIESQYQPKIKGTIDYLPTDKMWEFGRANLNLNTNTSTVHVPTNIYDKCELYFICCSVLPVATAPPLATPLSPPLPKEKSGLVLLSPGKTTATVTAWSQITFVTLVELAQEFARMLYWIGVFNLPGIPAACTTSVVVFYSLFCDFCWLLFCVYMCVTFGGGGGEGREMGRGGGGGGQRGGGGGGSHLKD